MSSVPAASDADRSGLRVESLSVSYAGRKARALRDVSFEVPPGAFLALVGASGSGKTSLLRAIAGLLPPDASSVSGFVWVGENRIDELPPERRKTPLVFQNLALFPHLSARENILAGAAFGGVSRDEARRRTASLAEMLRISDVLDARPDQLSGGQAQRVALARALVQKPRTLLMDEPFGSLDAPLRQRMREDLYRIWQEVGTTCVFVTHDPIEAADLGTHLGVLHAGRLVQLGERDTVLFRPRDRLVAHYFGYENQLPIRAVARDVDGDLLEVVLGSRHLFVRNNPEIVPPQDAWLLVPRAAFFRPPRKVAQDLPITVRRCRPFSGGLLIAGKAVDVPSLTVHAWIAREATRGILDPGSTVDTSICPESIWVIPRMGGG